MPISEKLAYEIFTIEFWHIASLLLSLGVNYYIYLKARKTPVLFAYLLSQAMIAIWMISKICKTVSPTIELRWFFIVSQYFGVSFLGSALLLFAVLYSKRKMPKLRQILLWNLPALTSFLIVLTNPLHHRFYSTFTFYKDTFGPLFYATMAVSYGYIGFSISLLSKGFVTMFGAQRTRAYLFVVGILIPLLVNVFYALGLFRLLFDYRPLFDYTPIATNISLATFAIAALRYRFLDILPAAQTQILDATNDAIALHSKNGVILYANRSFCELFPQHLQADILPAELAEDCADTLCLGTKRFNVIRQHKKNFSILRLRNESEVDRILTELEAKKQILLDANQRLEQLAVNKQNLVALKTRSLVLQELHDVLGHTMVLAISSCESEALSGAKNYEETLERLEELLSESKSELNRIFYKKEDAAKRTSLLMVLEELTKKASNKQLACEVSVMGSVFELPAEVSEAVYRVCREGLTNAIKHANATKFHIVLRYNEDDLEVFVFDNGKGCERIQKGKGLNGIEQALQSVQGQVSFSSDEDCGFHMHACVPRRLPHAL